MVQASPDLFRKHIPDEERNVIERLVHLHIEDYKIATIISNLRWSALHLAADYSPQNSTKEDIYKCAAKLMQDATRHWQWRNAKDFYDWILIFDAESKGCAAMEISTQWSRKIYDITHLKPTSRPIEPR